MSYNIYICGIGGQGIIKTSIIIGETALTKNLNVVMSEIHGMSQRGGVVSTELKIGDDKSPIIPKGASDLVIAFEPVEALRALEKTNSNTKLIVNTSTVMPATINQQDIEYPELNDILEELNSKFGEVYSFDANQIAIESGHPLSANMAMLGGATAISTFPLEKNDVLEVMKNNLPSKSIEINVKAFNKGFDACKK